MITGLRIYFAGIGLAVGLSLVDLWFALASGTDLASLGLLYLVWLSFGAAALIGLLSLLCSANVRTFVMFLGVLPPGLVAFVLFTVLYPIYVPFPIVMFIGVVKTSEDASSKSRT
jgi:hypothetical protein